MLQLGFILIWAHKTTTCCSFLILMRIWIDLFYSFPGGSVVKNLSANAGATKIHGFDPWVRKIPWRRKWQPLPLFLPGKSQGQRSLAGCSPWGSQKVGHDRAPEHTHTSSHRARCPRVRKKKDDEWRNAVRDFRVSVLCISFSSPCGSCFLCYL